MKTLKIAALVAVVALVVSGCAGIQTAKNFNGQKLSDGTSQNVVHVNGSNWGLYLLSIPILTGSTDKLGDMSFNKDTVRVSNVVDIVTRKAKESGATKTIDLTSSTNSAYIFPVFFLKSVQVSGNGVK